MNSEGPASGDMTNASATAAASAAAGARHGDSAQYCTGDCIVNARQMYELAETSIKPSTANRSEVHKRFQFLNEAAATDTHKQAEILLEHALALYELMYGQEHPSVAKVMFQLAAIYSLHGNKEQAAYMTQWANEIMKMPKEEPTHEFFHLFGLDKLDDRPLC